MKKKVGLLMALSLSLLLETKAADNVYVNLVCESNINVKITLQKQDESGWVDVVVDGVTKRASYIGGSSNDMGGDRLSFATRGLALDVDYSASRDFFITFVSERGRNRFPCKVN